MIIARRRLAAAAVLGTLAAPAPAAAQQDAAGPFPSRPIRLIVF